MANEASVVRDEKRAEAEYQKEKKEAEKRSFSVSLSGPKDTAADAISAQVKNSAIASALKAIIAAGPGNACSVAGTMESSEDGSKGTITINGNFETIADDVLKAHADADAAATKARGRSAKK
jgi:hypothetical protein